jgi:hypothetical protein
MKHPAAQVAPLHTLPEPQLAPLVSVHADVLVPGWQL